ncbi:MAG: outer membrane protein assembly factor BamE [Methylococcaceae bacterium]
MKIVFILLLLHICTACTTTDWKIPGTYAIDVQQGNIINQTMINQLSPGMPKRQVLYVLGSPMLRDAFHSSRWDYIYSVQPGGDDRTQKKIAVLFDGDKLKTIQGDFRPSNIKKTDVKKESTVDVPKRQLEKTMFQKIKSLFGYET